jgi:hypothetical protein
MQARTPSPAAIAIPRPRQQSSASFFERNWRHFFELLFIIPAYTAYQFVRGTVGGEAGTAFDNARHVIRIEQALHIYHEAFLQQLILPADWAVGIFNTLYIWGHLPIIITVAVWLYMQHRGVYALYRNAFLISGLIALIGFSTVPLAPPRYMPEFGFVDTIINAKSYYVFQNPKIVNQYAAMPSLHFGWDMLVATAIFFNTRSRMMKIIAAVMPVIMLCGIVMTGNHYFLDAAAGALTALIGFGIAYVLHRGVPRANPFAFLT